MLSLKDFSPYSWIACGDISAVPRNFWIRWDCLLRKMQTNETHASMFWFFFFFLRCGHAECDLFCQVLMFLDADAFCVSFAAEEMLPVEAAFWNRVVAFRSFKERSRRAGRAVCWWARRFPGLGRLGPAAFMCVFSETLVWCVYVIYPRAWRLMRKERAGPNVGELAGQKWCWHTSTSESNLGLLVYLLFS